MNKKLEKILAQKTHALAASLTPRELFTSNEFLTHAQNLVMALVGKKGHINVVYDPNGELTACTDGKQIILNAGNDIISAYALLLNQFMAACGMVFHEIAHIQFCDFDTENKAIACVEAGQFYGKEPVPSCEAEENALADIKGALTKPEYAKVVASAFKHLANIVDDVHDEGKICAKYGGLVEKGIVYTKEALGNRMSSLEDNIKAVSDKRISKMELMFNITLQFARFEKIVCDNESTMGSEYAGMLAKIAKPLEAARYTDSVEIRFEHLNNVILALWPYIAEELDKAEKEEQKQQKQNGGQPQSGASNAAQKVADKLQQAAKAAGATAAPQNGKSSAAAKKARAAANKGTDESKAPGSTMATAGGNSGEEDMKKALSAIVNSIGTAKAEEEVEQDLTSTLLAEVNGVNQCSTHRGRKTHLSRVREVTQADIARYNKTMTDIKQYSRRLQKQLLEALRDLRDGSVAKHKAFGNRFEPSDAYRPDQKMFTKKKAPLDWPDMAIGVLVDHSGSMSGTRLEAAMKAAMLLHDFATGLGIPAHIAGHNTTHDGINYFVYTDFDAVGDKDRYRLAKMKAFSCNRDGMAIEIIANRLAKRPEEIKMLIVISDGQPNDSGYGGEGAFADISGIVKRYRRQGIQTFAAAIGDDKDKIKRIYGDGFLDVSNLDAFPKALVKLVKKRITP